MRQIIANIEQRRKLEFYRDGKLVEWQTRALASVLASTAQTDQKGFRQLSQMVDSIRFRTNEQAEHEAGSSPTPAAGMTDEEIEEMLEKGSTVAADKNTETGAVTRLMVRAGMPLE